VEVIKVKENGQGGYTVNDTMIVPNAESNRHYRMVQEWIAEGGIVEPFETAEETTAREQREANALIHQELIDLDKDSIRDIIEWVASQPSAPKALKDREAASAAARGRLS